MGPTTPWLDEVKRQALSMPWATEVLVGVSDMARLMADSDLAVGAAGATSWERCCLGLPTIMLVLADNQRQVAQGLEQGQAARTIERLQDIGSCLPKLLRHLIEHPSVMQLMSQSATRIVDGKGVSTVVHLLGALT
jgi:spore coat polysaccharide biosynthesis predicted glycosyltransferase SpsG